MFLYLFLEFFFCFHLLFSNDKPQLKEEANPIVPGYFSFPLSPGVPTSLSGTFGDLRINHFHAGLDIRTGGAEGKSIFAAAEGYVSRINISRGGYGNALYITHPNGLVTVYAHLKEFSPKIKERLLGEQYAKKTWELDFYLPAHELEVSKGELVALSGNTGGSAGPHLHFEIRDKDENTLDPALYQFPEIKDNVAPFAEFISFVCKSADARVNGQFGVFDFPVKKQGMGYTLLSPITLEGDIGIELMAYDKAETSPFRLGISRISLQKDNNTEYNFELDKLAFHNKLDMNLHTNYERMVNTGKKLHKCYLEPGNSMQFYKTNKKNGLLNFRSDQVSEVKISMSDTFGNLSTVFFSTAPNSRVTELPLKQAYDIQKIGDFLKIRVKNKASEVRLKNFNNSTVLSPAYLNTEEPVYIYDLKNGLYQNILIGNSVVDFPVNFYLTAEKKEFRDKDFHVDFSKAYYKNEFLNLKTDNYSLILDKDNVPLKDKMAVTWQKKVFSSYEGLYLDGKKPKFQGKSKTNDIWQVQLKELGTFKILNDTYPPSIKMLEQTKDKLVFRVSDELSDISHFECFVNNEWVLMEYEFKNGLLWSEKHPTLEAFSGDVLLKVYDKAGNTGIYQSKIL